MALVALPTLPLPLPLLGCSLIRNERARPEACSSVALATISALSSCLCAGPLVDRLLNDNFLPLSLLTTHLGGVSTSDARQGLRSVSGETRDGGGAGCVERAARCVNGAGDVEEAQAAREAQCSGVGVVEGAGGTRERCARCGGRRQRRRQATGVGERDGRGLATA